MHAVEYYERRKSLSKSDVEAADHPQPVFISPVSQTRVRRYGKPGLALEALAHGRIKRLARRSAYSIRACAQNQRGPATGLPDYKPVCERAYLIGSRIVFNSDRERRYKFVSECCADARSRNLIVDYANACDPTLFDFIFRPADRAALARSERSTRHARRAFDSYTAV